MKPTHNALIAQNHRLRNRQRHRCEAHAAATWPDGEAACALRQKAEPRAGAVVDLDAADAPVRVGIELDRDVIRIVGGRTLRHFDEAGGAANAKRCRWRRDLHVAGLCHRGGDESGGALGDVEDRRVALAAVLIDVIVDGDLRARLEIKGGGVDEGDAERGIRSSLHHVVEIDVVLDLERRGLVVADHAGAAGHGGDVADRLLGRLRISGRRGGVRRGGIGRGRRRCGRLRRLGLCLRQLRRPGRTCENLPRPDQRAASKQHEREGKLARHRVFPFTEGKAEGGNPISAPSG